VNGSQRCVMACQPAHTLSCLMRPKQCLSWLSSPPPSALCTPDQALASSGVASRRACIDLVKAGKVQVNGSTVTDPATKVRPRSSPAG
jgi:hypothetical protein